MTHTLIDPRHYRFPDPPPPPARPLVVTRHDETIACREESKITVERAAIPEVDFKNILASLLPASVRAPSLPGGSTGAVWGSGRQLDRPALGLSLTLHLAIVLTVALQINRPPRPKATPMLVFQIHGVASDQQLDEKIRQQKKGQASETASEKPVPKEPPVKPRVPPPKPEAQQKPKPQTTPPKPPEKNGTHASQSNPAASQTKAPTPPKRRMPERTHPPARSVMQDVGTHDQKATPGEGRTNIIGADRAQRGQSIVTEQVEQNRNGDLVKLLTSQVLAHLAYPEAARQKGLEGEATVAFTVMRDGRLRPDSLRIVTSSQQPVLDAAALDTVRASVPFPALPEDMTIGIVISFSRK